MPSKTPSRAFVRERITVDATDQIVGRLATRIAHLLMGKHKASYVPHEDRGAIVTVTNADTREQKCRRRFYSAPVIVQVVLHARLSPSFKRRAQEKF